MSEWICMKFSGKVGNGPMNKWLNFGGDPDHDPYHDTGKTCFGGGMHCPSWHPTCNRVTIHLEKSGNCKVVMENGEQSGEITISFCMPAMRCCPTNSALTLLVGRQEGHPPARKNTGDGGGGHWLVRMEWRLAGWSVCLPLLISPCTTKSRSSLLAPVTRVVPEKGP